MKNLRIFVFQQHWFHLGSLLEAIIDNDKNYKSITIYNMLGQVVLKKAVISNEEAIDITTLATGVYTMSFNNAKVSRKFVKN
jgi:hypothetical protein